MSPSLFWYSCFAAFAAAFLFIMLRTRDPRFAAYAVSGAALGYFVFDVPSVQFGYYSYNTGYFLFAPLGVPVTMALAEGFCVAIAIYLYERLAQLLGPAKKK